MDPFKQTEPPLFRDHEKPVIPHYSIHCPAIKSGAEYYFETASGLRYQVLFAKKKRSYLENIVNFSVLSDEFEDEYSETNRGEIYRIIATLVEIIRIYHSHHTYSTSYEFSGEFKKGNENRETSIRTLLYYRKAREVMHPGWTVGVYENRVVVRHRKGK